MKTLLHLDSSADRGASSVSRRLSAAYADIWRTVHGDAGYRYRDLALDPVPPLGPAFCALGRRLEADGLRAPTDVHGALEGEQEKLEWALTLPLITELLAAGTVLIGTPMYNFSVPASLKAWIDRVSFPGALLDHNTGRSALADTRVVVTAARGGAYGAETPRAGWDFQTPYLRAYFSANGVSEENLHFVTAEMTMAGVAPHLTEFRPAAQRSLATALRRVATLAG